MKIELQNKNFIFTILIVFFLSLVTLVFFGYGVDDYGYLYYWNKTYPLYEYILSDKKIEQRAIEVTYSYLFSFFKLFTDDFEVFKFFNTLITLSIMSYAYYKVSKKYYLYMLIYTSIYLFIDFNIDQFRNALAASFGLLAIVQLSKKETYYSYFNFILAVLIHNSMSWLAVIYLSKNTRYNKVTLIFLVFLIFIPNKVNLLIDFLDNNFFDTIGLSHLFGKIQFYALESHTSQFSELLFSFFIGKTILIYALGYLVKMDKTYLYTYLYATLFYYLLIDFNTFGARIVREALVLEPIFLYFLLKNNLRYILVIPFMLAYNIFSKNLPLIDRMIN
ncbi:MAG: EpsG family protein [Sulfuricurvum sp.]|jgi:hypothetical protein